MSRFRGDGDLVLVDFPPVERELLTQVLSDLRDLLMADDVEALRRLRPPAHPHDPDAEVAYRELIDNDLLRGRLEAIDCVETTLADGRLDVSGVAAWMQSLNCLRLVLGGQLEFGGVDLAGGDLPDTPSAAVYEWTGWLLEQLISTAAEVHPF